MSTADFSSKTVQRNMTRSTGKLNLRTAEQERVRLTAAQQRQIQRLYENVAKEVAKQAEKAPRVPSDALRKQYLNQLQKQLNEELEKIRGEIESTVKGNMKKTAEAVVGDNIDFLKEVGMPVQGAFSHVPDEVVRAVATGQVYEGRWSLSRAIWKNTKRTQKDVQSVIAQGIAQNKSAYDIAKDLEKYVDPSARKDWDWSKVYPGTARKVDYSAQRLARTMVSHAYQQSFVRTTQKNPFVTKYKWVSSGGARTCEICAGRDGVEYSKTDLPLDHPNGMCTFIAVIKDSMTDIADRIADWANGKPDPELDTWAKDLGSKASEASPLSHMGVPVSTRGRGEQFSIDPAYLEKEGFFKEFESGLAWCKGALPKFSSGQTLKGVEFYKSSHETALAYCQGKDGILHINYDKVYQFTSDTLAHEMIHASLARSTTWETREQVVTGIVKESFKENGLKSTKKNIRDYVTDYAATNNEECLAEATSRVCIAQQRGRTPNSVCKSIFDKTILYIEENYS